MVNSDLVLLLKGTEPFPWSVPPSNHFCLWAAKGTDVPDDLCCDFD